MRTITVTTMSGYPQQATVKGLDFKFVKGALITVGGLPQNIVVPGEEVRSLDISREHNEHTED